MKKRIIAGAVMVCLIALLLSTSALLRTPPADSVKGQGGENATNPNPLVQESAKLQVSNSEIQQATSTDAAASKVDVPDNRNEFTMSTPETSPSQVFKPPVPLPDGRIFLRASGGPEDVIPYIPTEYPKTSITAPLVPLELDN